MGLLPPTSHPGWLVCQSNIPAVSTCAPNKSWTSRGRIILSSYLLRRYSSKTVKGMAWFDRRLPAPHCSVHHLSVVANTLLMSKVLLFYCTYWLPCYNASLINQSHLWGNWSKLPAPSLTHAVCSQSYHCGHVHSDGWNRNYGTDPDLFLLTHTQATRLWLSGS